MEKSTSLSQKASFNLRQNRLHLAGQGVGNGKAAEFIDAPVAFFPATSAARPDFPGTVHGSQFLMTGYHKYTIQKLYKYKEKAGA